MIQDHIESIGKPIPLKGDEVLLNGLLAQVLSDIAPKPSTTFSIQICPNPKLQLGPMDSFYPEPPSSYDVATARNPNSSVSSIRVSVSPRWPCQHSLTYCIYFGLTELCSRSHRVGLADSLLPYCFNSVSPSGCNWCHRDDVCPKHWSHRVVPVGPTEIPNVHILN